MDPVAIVVLVFDLTGLNCKVGKSGKKLIQLTPPIAKIICVKNVGAIVVCGFFMK